MSGRSIVDGIIPVVDLKGGQVVHAVAGQRANYRPVISQIAESADPSTIAEAFSRLGFDRVYVADLDSILQTGANANHYESIRSSGLSIWLDSGVNSAADAVKVLRQGIDRIVVGIESIESPQQIAEILDSVEHDRVTVSVDMKDGRILTKCASWVAKPPNEVAHTLIELGTRSLILLDLSRVGTGNGTGTEQLLQQIKATHPQIELTVGGGVKTRADVHRLLDCGASNILVSTALHNGELIQRI
ncbi:MAG: hypothetical protein KDB27_30705 [Planctomycetales bacterium]|nr:hypothetical protein [Planctomycetales bacterium]